MKKTSITLTIIALICAFTLYDGKDTTQKEPEQIRYHAERMKNYMPVDLGIVYIEPIKCKLRDRGLKIKFWRE